MAVSLESQDRNNEKEWRKNDLILGLDVGTTTIKVSVVSSCSKQTLCHHSIEHNAYIETAPLLPYHREQSVEKILSALNKCVELLPGETLQSVKEIAVCGQMHGSVLWDKRMLRNVCAQNININMQTKFEQMGSLASALITWEDGRCSTEFLNSLPKGDLKSPLASGFGCATLFLLHQQSPDMVKQYDGAGTIMDLVVYCLTCAPTDDDHVVYMSTQNAYSWGYFNVEKCKWELDLLTQGDFPIHLLPVVCEPCHIVGELAQCWYGIPSGATVRVALGDMQCSIFATMAKPGEAVFNVGTSIQLSLLVKSEMQDVVFNEVLHNPALDIASYFENICLVVAPSLTGGNALACFVKMLQSWMCDLGLGELSSEVIYQKLYECESKEEDGLRLNISPVLWGERHYPTQRGAVGDITQQSLSLGNVYRSLCDGLVVNVLSMMSLRFMGECGIQKLTGTGNALVRNTTLQQSVNNHFNVPFELCKDADAAVGVALSTIQFSK